MCFAPQRHALFEHLNFRKCSERGVLCTCWLRNVLRATTACTFQNLNFQKCSEPVNFLILLSSKCASHHHFFDIRTWGVFIFFTSKCASRHNGVQFFISHLARRLRTALASLLFDPLEPQIIGKHGESRLFYPFAHLHLISSDSFSSPIFSLLLFSSWLFPPLLFHLSILSVLTSKFPSIKMCIYIYVYIHHTQLHRKYIQYIYIYNMYIYIYRVILE